MNFISQFADDTSLYLQATERNIHAVSESLTEAQRQLGLKVNIQKTTIYKVGSLKGTNAKYYMQAKYAWSDPPIYTLGAYVSTNFHEMAELNIKPIISQIQTTMASWTNRNLTLTGRILIANTLMESKLAYRFGVTPLIPHEYMTQLQNSIVQFVWAGKKPKISFDILSSPKEHGGMRLCDVQRKHRAVLIQWILNLQKDSYLRRDMYTSLCATLGENIWKCNIKPKDVLALFQDSFWTYVLTAWSHFNYKYAVMCSEIRHQIIWFNSNLMINGKPLWNEQMYMAGLVTLQDLTNNNLPLTWSELKDKYPTNYPWLTYQSIVDAVPRKWWEKLRSADRDLDSDYIYPVDMVMKQPKPTAVIYSQSIARPIVTYGSYKRWKEYLDILFNYDQFLNLFINIKYVTNVVKFRDFQYRLLHKKVPANKELCRWGIKSSENCPHCDVVEDIRHLLYDCRIAKKLWDQLALLVTQSFEGELFVFNFQECLANTVHAKPRHLANLYCLVLKQYIYRSKCLKEIPNFRDYLNEIKSVQVAELTVAKNTGLTTKHYRKWKHVETESTTFDFNQFIDNYIYHM